MPVALLVQMKVLAILRQDSVRVGKMWLACNVTAVRQISLISAVEQAVLRVTVTLCTLAVCSVTTAVVSAAASQV